MRTETKGARRICHRWKSRRARATVKITTMFPGPPKKWSAGRGAATGAVLTDERSRREAFMPGIWLYPNRAPLKRFFRACAAVVAIVAGAAPALAETAVTFDKDVAPVLYARCASCHRPGEIGPFSLLTYRDVRLHATQIADVAERRVMPPWKPERGKGAFVGDRSLSDDEIRLLRTWVAQGAVEGDARDLPPQPQWMSVE